MMGGSSDCNKVITIPQYSGVCWFTTMLMALLYSSGMRKLVVDNSKTWKPRSSAEKGVLDVIKTIVSAHYAHTYVMKAKAYDFFERVTPEALLASLNKMDSARFQFNPASMMPGFSSTVYLPAMLDLLRVRNVQMFDAISNGSGGYALIHSPMMHGRYLTKRELLYENEKRPADAVILFVRPDKHISIYPKYYYVMDMPEIPLDLGLPGRRVRYRVDSVLMGSHNNCSTNHQIAGITCDGGRYIYNGWLRKELNYSAKRERVVPCELMPVDWMDQKAPSFKIAGAGCGLERYSWLERLFSTDYAFSFRKGERTYIYTRK